MPFPCKGWVWLSRDMLLLSDINDPLLNFRHWILVFVLVVSPVHTRPTVLSLLVSLHDLGLQSPRLLFCGNFRMQTALAFKDFLPPVRLGRPLLGNHQQQCRPLQLSEQHVDEVRRYILPLTKAVSESDTWPDSIHSHLAIKSFDWNRLFSHAAGSRGHKFNCKAAVSISQLLSKTQCDRDWSM